MNLAAKLCGVDADLFALISGFMKATPGIRSTDLEIDEALWDRALVGPARDILERSGKGVRARLVERSWQLAGGNGHELPEVLPVVIELLHVGSLVIDDIEDDSATRRGAPTLHRRYGVPVALNTGNWCLFMSLALLSRVQLDPATRLALYEDLSRGLVRCHQGQALDLSVDVTSVAPDVLPMIVAKTTRLKTGTLMALAARMGARAAGAPPLEVHALGRFGGSMGVGLQMLDDWSGIGIAQRRQKGIEDIRLRRPTWPWVWAAETIDAETFGDLVRAARAVSEDENAEELMVRMRSLLSPQAGGRIHRQLTNALSTLSAALGSERSLDALRSDLEELEGAYG